MLTAGCFSRLKGLKRIINQILKLANQEASCCAKKGYQFQLCSKVDYRVTGDLSSQGAKTGYCLDETQSHLQLLPVLNQIINVPKPVYDESEAIFDDDKYQKICYTLGATDYDVKWACPIRIVILKNAYENFRLYANYCVTNPDRLINEGLLIFKFYI